MLKPVNSAAIAHLTPPGWSVSPAYLEAFAYLDSERGDLQPMLPALGTC
jgi:hypothetical protein